MIKWFVYIVLLLLAVPRLSFAQNFSNPVADHSKHPYTTVQQRSTASDTTQKTKQQKQQDANDPKKIKEVAKAKRQTKPEKLDDQSAQPNNNNATPPPAKPKRERRPAGLERPPEIPRRNGN